MGFVKKVAALMNRVTNNRVPHLVVSL